MKNSSLQPLIGNDWSLIRLRISSSTGLSCFSSECIDFSSSILSVLEWESSWLYPFGLKKTNSDWPTLLFFFFYLSFSYSFFRLSASFSSLSFYFASFSSCFSRYLAYFYSCFAFSCCSFSSCFCLYFSAFSSFSLSFSSCFCLSFSSFCFFFSSFSCSLSSRSLYIYYLVLLTLVCLFSSF